MGAKTRIEWTDGGATWTPIRARRDEVLEDGSVRNRVGWHCEHKSEGCRNCYAETMNMRLGTKLLFKPGHRADVELFLDEEMLLKPLHWRRPRKIFVCSMTDIFADFVLDEWIDRIFAVMALCPQHTFIVLTKRPERMRAYIRDAFGRIVIEMMVPAAGGVPTIRESCARLGLRWTQPTSPDDWYPFANVWLGVSVEDQPTADERIPHLLRTLAAKRLISAEPLLGPAYLSPWLDRYGSISFGDYDGTDCVHCGRQRVMVNASGVRVCEKCERTQAAIDWVIVGGESGPKDRPIRPMHPDWVRSLRDQCSAANVPFFFKQWGEWTPFGTLDQSVYFPERVGKKAAGAMLDGREHREFPT